MTKGISLHIGLNSLNADVYGASNNLNLSESDAKAMEKIAKSLGYVTTKTLLTKSATIKNVVTEIQSAAKKLKEGDIFFLTYSGHGNQQTDTDNEEADGQDETWCLYDGELLDDSLYSLWKQFKPNTRIVLISDSCNSGTVSKTITYVSSENKPSDNYHLITREIDRHSYSLDKELRDLNRNLKCPVKLYAAAKDGTSAREDPNASNGRFTTAVLNAWDNGNFTGNYDNFFEAILHELNKIQHDMKPNEKQKPQYTNIGKSDVNFNKQKPFTI